MFLFKVVVGSRTESCKAQKRSPKNNDGEGATRKRAKKEMWLTSQPSQANMSPSLPQPIVQEENVKVKYLIEYFSHINRILCVVILIKSPWRFEDLIEE